MTEPQTTDTIFMVRPDHFASNPETAPENSFMRVQDWDLRVIDRERSWALREFDTAVAALRAANIRVFILDTPPGDSIPDAVFPNNWVSFHVDQDGRQQILLYPMMSPLRRRERQPDALRRSLRQSGFWSDETMFDATFLAQEERGCFLEGTGSLVLSRPHRMAFVAYSQRTDPDVAYEWSRAMRYTIVPFFAMHIAGHRIYHTNVLMSIGDGWAVICPEAIDEQQSVLTRSDVRAKLEQCGLDVIEITRDQMEVWFCANILELKDIYGNRKIVMSTTAYEGYRAAGQLGRLEQYGEIVATHIPTIERVGGGSLRCMIAEVFYPGLVRAASTEVRAETLEHEEASHAA